jgi:hypothetical protein
MSRPYWWFEGASVAALIERLSADARLEVHLDGEKMTFRVVPLGGALSPLDPPINESHICPPQCP